MPHVDVDNSKKFCLFLFVWVEALRPSQQFSVMSGRGHRFRGITSTLGWGFCILLKDTTRRPE